MTKNNKIQTGMDIMITIIIIIIFSAILMLNACYTLDETQEAVITTFGKVTVNDGKGIQWKVPFIQKVRKVDTTIKGFPIGYAIDSYGNETYVEDESTMITSDYNFINLDFYISYKVSDPAKYLYNSNDPTGILKNLAQNCIRTVVSGYPVDSVLTTGKSEIQSNIKQMMIQELEELDIGLALDEVSLQDAEPPTLEISNAFKAVETAKQDKESLINQANKYRNENLPAAKANVDKILQAAESSKQSRINEAIGEVAKYNKMYEEYLKYPLITKQRMFYETMEDLLPKMKVIIDNGNGDLTNVVLDDSLSSVIGGN